MLIEFHLLLATISLLPEIRITQRFSEGAEHGKRVEYMAIDLGCITLMPITV